MKVQHDKSATPKVPKAKIAILHSEYYPEHIESLVKKCIETLGSSECDSIDVFSAPGCVELPLCAKRIAKMSKAYEAIICFGIIIKVDTYHFDIVFDSVTRGLNQVMLEEDIPIIIQVLPADNLSLNRVGPRHCPPSRSHNRT